MEEKEATVLSAGDEHWKHFGASLQIALAPFLATELLFRLFLMLEAEPVIGEHQAVGQKDVFISAVWWNRGVRRQGKACRQV